MAFFFYPAWKVGKQENIAPVSKFERDNGYYLDKLREALAARDKDEAQNLLEMVGIYGIRLDKPMLNLGDADDMEKEIAIVQDYFRGTILDGILYDDIARAGGFLEVAGTNLFKMEAADYIIEILEELLYNSIHVFDGQPDRKFILALSLDVEKNEIKIMALDTGPGIENIPKAVETSYSSYQGESDQFGDGRGLSTPLMNIYFFRGGEVVVQSKGKRFVYTYNSLENSFLRTEMVSKGEIATGTFLEVTLPLPKTVLMRDMNRLDQVKERLRTCKKVKLGIEGDADRARLLTISV